MPKNVDFKGFAAVTTATARVVTVGNGNGKNVKKGDNMENFGQKKINININSSVSTLSIKIYDEQLPGGWEDCQKRIVGIDDSEIQVIAIKHDRDLKADGFWRSSFEKAHYHIILRVLNGGRKRVNSILDMLGVVYREGIDDSMIENHGLETVGRFRDFAVYLTHETEQAILEGKEKYELSELVSNMTIDEIKKSVRDISA